MRPGPIALAAILALVLSAATSDAASLTTPKCLAGKARAAASLRKCRLDVGARLLEGKDATLAKCELAFESKLAKLDEKATKAGIACRFRDNGDGTVTDYDTGLQWEKKNSFDGVGYYPNPHDVDNVYKWSTSAAGLADGGVFTEFLGRLNGSTDNPFDIEPCVFSNALGAVIGGFAGHCDWRLPTLDELKAFPAAAVLGADTIFDNGYATSTTLASDFGRVWYVHFGDGVSATETKTSAYFALGVRGGW